MIHNARVIELAREWIGTPYHHQQANKQVGVDCIGLVIGVWGELFNRPPKDFTLPPYSPSWAEETKDELMTRLMSRYMIPIPLGEQIPGDVQLYRMFRRGPTKHAAILVKPTGDIIHAYNGHDVMETGPITNVGSAITHVFRFPDEPDLVVEN